MERRSGEHCRYVTDGEGECPGGDVPVVCGSRLPGDHVDPSGREDERRLDNRAPSDEVERERGGALLPGRVAVTKVPRDETASLNWSVTRRGATARCDPGVGFDRTRKACADAGAASRPSMTRENVAPASRRGGASAPLLSP